MGNGSSQQGYMHFVNRLADELVASGAIASAPVERAFRKVPRHLFIDRGEVHIEDEQKLREVVCDHKCPDTGVLEAIYRDGPIVLSEGSTSSQPMCMAWMLEDLGLRPGMKVFEVGTASGWNAALLAELVGDPSLVYSVEVAPGLAESAKRHLEEAGYGGVTVICGDGAEGYAPGAPYDAIIVTCGCTDLSPAWVEQLSRNGVILCPLHIAPSGDPTLLARRSDTGLRGHFTRLIFFVSCQSDLMPTSISPSTIDAEEAVALAPVLDEVDFPLCDQGDEDRGVRWLFFLFLSAQMSGDDRLVTVDGFWPTGMANPVLREACVSSWEGRMKVIGGRGLLERFLQVARCWEKLGRPGLADYDIVILPAAEPAPAPANGGVLRRRHFQYVISVPSPRS
jgi:protein-L-isoaspartate(D-aspartate) O-methyltransferase